MNKGFKKIVITVKLKVLFIEGSMEVLNIRFDDYDDDFQNSLDVEVKVNFVLNCFYKGFFFR